MGSVASEAPKVSSTQERYLRTALLGHIVRSPNVEVHLELGRDCRSVWGHSTTIVRIWPNGPPVPVLALLSEDSTPRKTKVRYEAYEEFQAAAERLARSGERFYTVLRPDWAWPALEWTLEYR